MLRLLHNGKNQLYLDRLAYQHSGHLAHKAVYHSCPDLVVRCKSCQEFIDNHPNHKMSKYSRSRDEIELRQGYPLTDNWGRKYLVPPEVFFGKSYASLDEAPQTYYCEDCFSLLTKNGRAVEVSPEDIHSFSDKEDS